MSTQSGFQLKGNAPEIYEICWVPALMGQCAADLVDAASVHTGDRVLDVGCGTGVVAREAFRRAGSGAYVVGSDINAAMLDVAGKYALENDMAGIRWQECDATKMPFADEEFDVVLCQQGLQFMPDRAAAMAEMVRVLAPGGRLAVSVWRSPSPFSVALGDTLDRYFGEGTTAPWQVAFSLSDRNELRSIATEAGLKDAHVQFDVKMARHPNPIEFVLDAIAGSPMADAVSEMTDEERTKMANEIVSGMEPYIDDDGVATSAECHTLTGVKYKN